MPARRELDALAQRKRLLILESDLQRALVRAECVQVRSRLQWLNETRDRVRTASPWVAAAAGLAGVLVAIRGRQLARWIPLGLAAWRLGRDLWSPR